MSGSISRNARIILNVLVEAPRDQWGGVEVSGDQLAGISNLTAVDINDAVALLVGFKYAECIQAIGTQTYRFQSVSATPLGRYEFEKMEIVSPSQTENKIATWLPLKIDPKYYRVRVNVGEKGAGLICSTYNLDISKHYTGVEYYELVCSLDFPKLNIPSTRQATFQEELRTRHQAASSFVGSRTDELSHIKRKLQEAYGQNAKILTKVIEVTAESEGSWSK